MAAKARRQWARVDWHAGRAARTRQGGEGLGVLVHFNIGKSWQQRKGLVDRGCPVMDRQQRLGKERPGNRGTCVSGSGSRGTDRRASRAMAGKSAAAVAAHGVAGSCGAGHTWGSSWSGSSGQPGLGFVGHGVDRNGRRGSRGERILHVGAGLAGSNGAATRGWATLGGANPGSRDMDGQRWRGKALRGGLGLGHACLGMESQRWRGFAGQGFGVRGDVGHLLSRSGESALARVGTARRRKAVRCWARSVVSWGGSRGQVTSGFAGRDRDVEDWLDRHRVARRQRRG